MTLSAARTCAWQVERFHWRLDALTRAYKMHAKKMIRMADLREASAAVQRVFDQARLASYVSCRF